MELSKLKENEIPVKLLLLEDNQRPLQQRFNEKALFEGRLNHLRHICENVCIPVKGMTIFRLHLIHNSGAQKLMLVARSIVRDPG